MKKVLVNFEDRKLKMLFFIRDYNNIQNGVLFKDYYGEEYTIFTTDNPQSFYEYIKKSGYELDKIEFVDDNKNRD